MRTLRMIAIAVLASASWTVSGTVWAQIAAPRLNPVAIESARVTSNRSLKPFNPAVLSWSGASRIAVSRTDLEAEITTPTLTLITNTAEGTIVQGRYVGEFFSAAVESYQSELVDAIGGVTTDVDNFLAAVSFRFGDLLSAGVSQQTSEYVDANSSNMATLPLFGATLRIGETFFIGMATGDETVEESGGGTAGEVDRTVTQFGVAYLARDGENGLHLEFFRQTVDGYTDPVLGTGFEEETDAFTVELIFSHLLAGYESVSTGSFDTAGTPQNDTELTTITLGWAPEKGFSIVASVEEEEITNIASGNVFRIETTVIALAWVF